MDKEYLRTDRLLVGYQGVPLIRDISLSVCKGEILVLIGPNGAGKSTILKTLVHQLAPVGGTVWLDGQDLKSLSPSGRARKAAIVQPGKVQTEFTTVEEVVAMGRYPYTGLTGALSENDRKIIRESMRLLQTTEYAHRDFSCLSDGQRQRVLLARAVCQEPELLVLDEPTTFLDIHCQLDLLSVLRMLAKEKRLAVILSLHELELARQIADRIVFVKGDRIERMGTPEEVLNPEAVDGLFDLTPGAYRKFLNQSAETKEENTTGHYVLSEGKKLRCGFTTGTCAALAAQACARRLLFGIWPETVSLCTPKGWTVRVKPEDCTADSGSAHCAVRKDAGDDADRTNGCLIYANLRLENKKGILIEGGEGVGRVTKPGLDRPVGEAAINSVPRQMIRETLEEVFRAADYAGGARLLISVPQGAEIAGHTFNPQLGIEGGISILGTSGIVEPMSMQALVGTIEVELRQAAALGNDTVILTPGNYGMDFLKKHPFYPQDTPIVCVSNFIGDALDLCGTMGFRKVLLVGHAGKLVKLAGGIMNTHSRYADCRMELLGLHAALCGGNAGLCRKLAECATTDAAFSVLQENGLLLQVTASLLEAIDRHLCRRIEGKFTVGALLFSNVFGEFGRTEGAVQIIGSWESRKEG